jgi:5'-phosphate synthase pdxT subunit
MGGASTQPRPDAERRARLSIGVLAIQGDFAAHLQMLRGLGAAATEVRRPGDLDALDGLVIPGGESTTISMGIETAGLEPAIRDHDAAGRPIFGTCAGMIVLDRDHLGLLDAKARRNAFGRQRQSFEAEIAIEGIGEEPMRAVFIRAPVLERHGPEVEVLASWYGDPVVVRQASLLACAFHPELTDDSRLHALFMAMATSAKEARAGQRSRQESR